MRRLVPAICLPAFAGIGVLTLLAARAPAQVPAHLPPGTQRVSDQGISDLTRLRTTLRTTQPDLRLGQNFSDLYKFQDTDGSRKFARVSGALTAIFPQSEYADAQGGQVALIPAGTTFHIGRIKRFESFAPVPTSATFVPSALTATTQASLLVPVRSDSVISTHLDSHPRPTSPASAASFSNSHAAAAAVLPPVALTPPLSLPPRGMLSDESYRRKRIRELLTTAATLASAEP